MGYPIYLQRQMNDCGPICLKMVAEFFGSKYSLEYINSLFNKGPNGSSIGEIEIAADAIGLRARTNRITLLELKNSSYPGIIYCKPNHFMVLYSYGKTAIVGDPLIGIREISDDELRSLWLISEEGGILVSFDNIMGINKLHLAQVQDRKLLSSVEVERISNDLIDSHFKNCIAAGIAGSSINGIKTITSDIDIIILSSFNSEIHNETFEYADQLFHILILPYLDLNKVISSDYFNRTGIFIRILTHCKIIRDTNNCLLHLSHAANRLFAIGPPEINIRDFIKSRNAAIDYLDDLRGGLSFSQAIFVISKMIPLITDLNIAWHRKWGCGGKHCSAILEEVDSVFHSKLILGLKIFYSNNNSEYLIRVLMENITSFNNGATKKSNLMLMEDHSLNQFVIGLVGPKNILECYKEIVLPLAQSGAFTEYYILKNNNAAYHTISYFIVVIDRGFGGAETLERTLKGLNISSKFRLDFPYNYSNAIYGLHEIHSNLNRIHLHLYEKLRGIWHKLEIWSWDEAFKHASAFFVCFIFAQKCDENDFRAFSKYMLDYWLTKVDGPYLYLNHDKLIMEQEKHLSMMERDYARYKNVIDEMLGNSSTIPITNHFQFWVSAIENIYPEIDQAIAASGRPLVINTMRLYATSNTKFEYWLFNKALIDTVFDMLALTVFQKASIAYCLTKSALNLNIQINA
jgi:hypothetical protein